MRLQSSSTGGLAVGEADNRYLRLAGGTMTGELSALAGLNTTRPFSSGLVPQDSSDPLPSFPFVTEWNNAGKNWTAVRVSVTNSASGSASKLADFQNNGTSVFSIQKDGRVFAPNGSASAPALSFGSASNYGLYNPGFGQLAFSIAGSPVLGIDSAGLNLWASSLTWGTGFGGTKDTGLERDAAGVVKFTDGSGSLRDWKARRGSLSEYLDITEMSAPAAPAANTARLFVEDNGSGKTRLCVLFPTGSAQVLATEP